VDLFGQIEAAAAEYMLARHDRPAKL